MKRLPRLLAKDGWVLLALGLIVLVDRALLLVAFGFEYVGNDDLIFWQGATDYANGTFREPYFYAQNYNFMFEALLAVPFLWAGIPCHAALPLCTSMAALFPYFLFASVLYNNGHTIGAYVFLLMPLFLPVEYGMLTTMSRGFVAGLFFSGFLVFPLVRPDRLSSFAILAIAGSFGYISNPNALIFVVPVGVWIWMENIRRTSFYLTILVGVLPALAVQWLAREFYVSHPEHNVHSMWKLQFDLDDLFGGFTRLDRFFSYLSPITWSFGWAFLLGLVFIAIKLHRRSWRRSAARRVAFHATADGCQ